MSKTTIKTPDLADSAVTPAKVSIPLLVRENVPDYANMSAPVSASFTAQWGSAYRIDATSGNIVVLIPKAETSNQDQFIQLHRVDTSVNTVTVVSDRTNAFFQVLAGTDGHAFTVKAGSTVNIRSIGTEPVVTNMMGVKEVSRRWIPTDASSGPVAWYSFRDASTLTLSGSAITGVSNKGSLGVGFNLVNHGTSPNIVSSEYADFVGGALRTSASQSALAGANMTFGCSYQQAGSENTSLLTQLLDSRLGIHPQWGDGITYVDMPIGSRISANLSGIMSGTNPHASVGRKGANRELFVDGNPTAGITAAGGGTALSGSGFFALGATVTNNTGPVLGDFFSGNMYEAVLYAIALTNDERDRLSAYMLWAIGRSDMIHASNAYKTAPPLVSVRTF